jgi:hypothetical protein
LWARTAKYFTAQPGFISLRLHRAVSADAQYRWVNVANWESEAHFRAAHGTDEFRRVVTQPGWGGVLQLTDALSGDHRNQLEVPPGHTFRWADEGARRADGGCGAITAPQPRFASGALIRRYGSDGVPGHD